MRAVVFNAPHEMHLAEHERPKPGPEEVLVAVRAVGICAGDLYIYQDKNPYVRYPQVGGHEISGVIAELGEGMSEPQLGIPVVVEPFINCGKCYPCRVGKGNCCVNLRIIGVHQPGGFAEYVLAPARKVHRVPAGLSPVTASFTEPVAIAVQALRRAAVQAGERVLVLGCGPIGLALIEVARAYGAEVFATDVLHERLETAATLGATTMLADDTLTAAVLEHTNGEGMPVVIEATGVPAVIEGAVDLVASGGRLVIVGLVREGIGVSFPGLAFTRKEMTVLGSRASVNCFPEALRLLADGAVRYPEVATALPIWDAPAIFEKLSAHPGAMHKGVLVLEER